MASLRVRFARLLVAILVAACGGGGDSGSPEAGSTPPPTTPSAPTSVANASIDPQLVSGTSIDVASTATMFGTGGPSGNVPYAVAGVSSPLYGLDSSGEIVLAGDVLNGRVVLSAESTVLVLARHMLKPQFAPSTDLDATIRANPAFGPAVAAFRVAFNEGRNPVGAPEFQSSFGELVSSILDAASRTSGLGQTSRARALALPPNRLDPVADRLSVPPFPWRLLKLPIALPDAGGTVQLASLNASYIELRNATPVVFLAGLRDVNEIERVRGQVLEGVGVVRSQLGLGESLLIAKNFSGSFGVELTADRVENLVAILLQVLEAATGELSKSPACITTLRAAAQNAAIFGTTLVGEPATTISERAAEMFRAIPGLLPDCLTGWYVEGVERGLAARGAEVAAKLVKWQGTLAAVAPVAFHIAAYYAATRSPQPHRIGVCVSRNDVPMSCVAQMQLDSSPPPMAPRAFFSSTAGGGNIRFLDARGQPTWVPRDLVVSLSPELQGVVEFAETGYLPGEGLSYTLSATGGTGEGAITILDPATDKSVQVPVKVTLGRFEPAYVEVLARTKGPEVRLLERDGSRELLLPFGVFASETSTPSGKANLQRLSGSDRFNVYGQEEAPLVTLQLHAVGFGEIASMSVGVLPPPELKQVEGGPTVRTTVFTCGESADPAVCPRGWSTSHVYLAFGVAARQPIGGVVRLDPHTEAHPVRLSCGGWTPALRAVAEGVTYAECRRDAGQPANTLLFAEAVSGGQVTAQVSAFDGGVVRYTAYASMEGARIIEVSSPNDPPPPALP